MRSEKLSDLPADGKCDHMKSDGRWCKFPVRRRVDVRDEYEGFPVNFYYSLCERHYQALMNA